MSHTVYIIDNIKALSWKARLHKFKILPISFQMQNLDKNK